jgi:hypothetical protein
MQFDGGAQFQPINPDPNSQSYDAHEPDLAKPVAFTITGTGQLPDESAQGGAQGAGGPDQTGAQPGQTATAGQRPGGGLGAPIDPEGNGDPWAKYKWWILGLLGLALAGGAGVMLKASPATTDAVAVPAPVDITAPSAAYVAQPASAGSPNSLLQALKDELFELETDRLNGKLTPAQYAEHKAAFDVVLRRALNRS